jgi:hypothetical protein
MHDSASPRDDIAGLQADLGGEQPFPYLDVQRRRDLEQATQRWPFLMALRRERRPTRSGGTGETTAPE